MRKVNRPFFATITAYIWVVWAFALTVCLQLMHLSVNAQSAHIIDAAFKDLLFSTSHFGLTATPYVTPAARISKENTDRYHLNTSPQRGFEAGIQYALHLNNDWSVVTSLQVGFAGSNVRYRIPKEDIGTSWQEDIIEKGRLSQTRTPVYISLPIFLEKRWFTNSNRYWSSSIGANIRRQAVGFLGSTKHTIIHDGVWRTFFELAYDLDNPPDLWVNYNAAGGYHWLLKNKDLFSVRLIVNYSSTAIINANYTFDLPDKPIETGAYRLNGSFIGISASYMLTHTRKKQKRLIHSKPL